MPFTPADGVPCQLLPDGRLRVTAPVVWTGTHGDAVTIPAGTVTDLASVPPVARGLVDVGGPIGRAAIVHDVLCDAANAWSAAGCPEETRPRFLGPDIDGALRAAARDLGAAHGERWLYWVAVRYGALFGSKGRRVRWLSTVLPVLALTLPALLVAAPAVLGALVARTLLLLCELAAWPFHGHRPPFTEATPVALVHGTEAPRQTSPGRAQLWQAAATLAEAGQWKASSAAPAPVGPTSGPQRAVQAARVWRRPVPDEPAPWCGMYLRPCYTGCHPQQGCTREQLARSAAPREMTPRPGPCPPGTHSNTGTAADYEIAACPRCNPRPEEPAR